MLSSIERARRALRPMILSASPSLPGGGFMKCWVRSIAFCALVFSAPAFSQAYPSRPVRVVVPFPPGGVDVLTRVITTEMSKIMGQPVVLENRAGANGIIGSEAVMRAAPDGYTLLVTTSSTMISRLLLSKNVPFDPVRDFTAIGNMYESQ